MCSRIKVFAGALLLCLTLVALPAPAQETTTGEAEYKEGVYVGTTSDYRTDSVLPVDEGVTVASNPDLKRMNQKQRAKQLEDQDPYGGALTIISMVIVVSALAVLSILFLIFGRVSSALQRKRKKQAHGPKAETPHTDEMQEDSGEVIAAIAAAMAEHFSGKHDMEDYILTIRSMKRSYSPWNSKIYNLRHLPEVHHHQH